MNEIDLVSVELEHLEHLRGSGYYFVCSGCNQVYRKKPINPKTKIEECEYCDNKSFLPIREVIRKLELGLK